MMEQSNRWTDEMSLIPRLDWEKYSNAYQNGFALVTNNDNVFCHIIDKFDSVVFQELKRSFQADSEFNMLGIGVGKGEHEYHFLKTLSSHFKKITMDAVDPNSYMLQQFHDIVAKDDPSVGGSVDCRFSPISLQQCIASYCDVEGPKYNLITAVHSLYFTKDLKATINQLLAMTAKDGIILIQLGSDKRSLSQMKRRYQWVNEFNQHYALSDIESIIDGHGIKNYPLPLKLDVTELFDEKSEVGNNLLDFVTMTYQFRKTAPQLVVEDVIDFWMKRVEISEDGRKLTPGDEDLILLTKVE